MAGNAADIPAWQSLAGEDSSIYKKLFKKETNDTDQAFNIYMEWIDEGRKTPYDPNRCRKLYKKAEKLLKKSEKAYKSASFLLPGDSEFKKHF